MKIYSKLLTASLLLTLSLNGSCGLTKIGAAVSKIARPTIEQVAGISTTSLRKSIDAIFFDSTDMSTEQLKAAKTNFKPIDPENNTILEMSLILKREQLEKLFAKKATSLKELYTSLTSTPQDPANPLDFTDLLKNSPEYQKYSMQKKLLYEKLENIDDLLAERARNPQYYRHLKPCWGDR